MISTLALLLIVSLSVIVIFFGIYICVLADDEDTANSSNPVVHFFTQQLPHHLENKLGNNAMTSLRTILRKFKQHAFQLVYLIVVLGSWSIMFTYGYDAIHKSTYISSHHRYAGVLVFIMCISSFHIASNTPPGNITASTIALYDHYSYDNILYKNKVCPTLQIRKLARSKYDRYTKRHIPRFDHYCGWINQSVGERNYRYFLLFLLVHVFMCIYGSWAVYQVLHGEIVSKDLMNATFFNAVTGVEVKADYWIVFHYLYIRYMPMCSIFILMAVMALVLGIFLGFHLYISSKNMTTNEFFKWKSVRKWYKKEKQAYEQSLQEHREFAGGKETTDSNNIPGEISDIDVGCTGPRGEVLISSSSSSSSVPNRSIEDPGQMPSNIYDKGIVANFMEVLFPYSLREEAVQRYRQSKKQSIGEECHSKKGREDKPKII